MDPAALIGIGLAFGSVVAMVILEGGKVDSLLLPAPMVLVFGGTIFATLASGALKDIGAAAKSLPRALTGKSAPPAEVVDEIVALAERARRDGLLALEQEAQTVKDPFLKGALQSIADGVDAEELRVSLEDQIEASGKQKKSAAKFFQTMGGFAPTVGIIGTVVSLTHVLENLSEPSELGHMIAAAFVATLWGLLSSNFMWLPLASRLTRLAELDADRMTLMLEGVLAVQAGSQPRALGERLRAMLPDEGPAKAGKAGKAAKPAKGGAAAQAEAAA